jgi:hypothetical protein
MTFFAADRVKVSTTTSGTADFGLGSATSTAFRSFSGASVTNGATVHYSAYTATEFECGEGIYTAAGPTLSRDTIFSSSNGGLIVTFGSSPTVIISSLATDVISYEEGTWTPVITGPAPANDPTVTYSSQNGFYTKIGDTVHVYGMLTINTISGGSGDMHVDGLPFTVGYFGPGTFHAPVGAVNMYGAIGWGSSKTMVVAEGEEDTTRIVLSGCANGVARAFVQISDFSNGDALAFSLTYKTA